MDIKVNAESIRGMVQRLRACAGSAMSQSKAYEALSQVFVGKNWDTFCAMLKRETEPKVVLDAPVTLFVDAFVATSEDVVETADWCQLVVDNAFINRLLEMQAICRESGLHHVAETRDAAAWGRLDGGNQPNAGVERLCVSEHYWWFTMVPRHCDYMVESRQIDIKKLLDSLTGTEMSSNFVWSQDVLAYDSDGEPEALIDALVEEGYLDSQYGS